MCDLCDFSSFTFGGLWRHSNDVHLQKKEFKCGKCGEKFVYKKTMQNHMKGNKLCCSKKNGKAGNGGTSNNMIVKINKLTLY